MRLPGETLSIQELRPNPVFFSQLNRIRRGKIGFSDPWKYDNIGKILLLAKNTVTPQLSQFH